jgi:hypothetical protein
MRHVAVERRGRVAARLLLACALAAGGLSCGGVRVDGLGQQMDARPATPDTRPGDAGTSSAPLPGAGGKSVAVWTCSGGGYASNEGPKVGLSIGGVSGVGAVSAPSGSRVTLGHFADTVEDE